MYATRAAHDGRALEGGGGAEHEGYENALHLYLGWYLRECEVNACCLELTSAVEPAPTVPHFSRLQRYSTRRIRGGEVRRAVSFFC